MSLTIREFVKFVAPDLVGRGKRDVKCPVWPGDVFAICCSILDRSGAIRSAGTGYLRERTPRRAQRIEECKTLAIQWRLSAGRLEPCQPIEALWTAAIVESGGLEISSLGCVKEPVDTKIANACEALIKLCTTADEVFAGVGISPIRSFPPEDEEMEPNAEQAAEGDFWRYCDNLLADYTERDGSKFPYGATLCRDITPNRLRVLPKAQPPANGLSTRSLTTYLALCPPVDIPVNWYRYFSLANDRKCNLLLVPWPFEVLPSQFYDCEIDDSNKGTGWFGYSPDDDWHAPVNKVKELLQKARKHVGTVDAVVLPETSITREQFSELQAFLSSQRIPLIAGVCETGDRKSADGTKRLGRNYAALSFPSEEKWEQDTSFLQSKHHRWKLDGSQIESYGVATQLDPQKSWWEGIAISERSLNFFALRDWLCSCVLICEDLARLDPAGQFVRAVAPDLVIALLFDGPQLPTRWPAYHATVLADDPGCSVLTLSCLGMTKLCRPRSVSDASVSQGVVGMWRDPRKGHVSIKIPDGKEAALLTITRRKSPCETADGRSNSQVEGAPEFAGVYYL